jgi:OOP family OmpA-OmpF porin
VTETEVQLLDTGTITTNNIVFASSSADINVAQSAILSEIGETLSRWPELKMEIIGHTDNTGPATFNQKLSQQRAESVLNYLRTNYPDIDTSKYVATGRGEDAPIATNDTKEGRQANRRVELKVLNPEELKRVIEHRKLLER